MIADNSAIDPIDPVGPLVDDFLARHRRGEGPTVAEYAERHPELAERIKQLFPMLLAMEEAGADASAGATIAPAAAAEGAWAGPHFDRVGGYRLLREIGRGGMGIVYEAEQLALGRHVALKVLPMHAARGGSGLERFRLEARAAARLHHTNIVPVFEVGQDGDACFYAMQYIAGQPLDQVLDEVRKLRAASLGQPVPPGAAVAHSLLAGLPAPPPSGVGAAPAAPTVTLPGRSDAGEDRSARRAYYRSVARVGAQVAAALDYAHKEGVIHRDVKPSNLLLDADGRVWITDFGLAKTDGAALTQTGDIVGTVRYMAPERFNGWSDPRSDVYSLGLTLYEMLALRPAYDGSEQMKLMQQVLHGDPPALRKTDAHLPRDLETVVAKATDREPSRRYQTAAEFGADLQRFLDDRPILARRIGPGERAWRWARRNPALAAATALTFAALLVATVVSALFAAAQADSADKQRALSDELKKTLAEAQQLAAERDVALKETRGHAARSAVHRAQSLVERGQLHEAMLWLAHALELAPEEDADVRHFARTSFASLEADAPALAAMWEPHHPGSVVAAAFAADGATVLTGGEAAEGASGEARLWDATTGEPRTPPLPHEGSVTLVAISPDGAALLTACNPQPGKSELRIWDAATGQPLTDPVPYPGTPTALVCGPKGKTFFTIGSPKSEDPAEARFWKVADNSATSTVLAHAGPVTAVAIGPKGDTVVTAWHSSSDSEGGLRLWEALTGQPTISRALSGVVTAATVAADGSVWVGTDVGSVWHWDPAPEGLAYPRQWLYEARGTVRGLSVSPAGDFALVVSENIQTGRTEARLWDANRGQWLGVALPHEAAPSRAAFGPDGRHVLAWHSRQPVRSWDLDTGRRWSAALPVSAPGGVIRGAVHFGADSGSVLTLAMSRQAMSVRSWDGETGTARRSALNLAAPFPMAAISPDGRTALLISAGREARCWDLATNKPAGPRITFANTLGPQRIVFSPDGKTVALAGSERVWLIEVPGGKEVRPSFTVPGPLSSIGFSADGKSLWLTTPNSVRCLNAATGQDAAPGVAVRGRGFQAIIPDAAGRRLAVLDQSGVALWDTVTGDRADFAAPRSPGPAAVAFTPDGRELLTADPSGFGAQLWDVAFGKPVGLPIRCPSFFSGAAIRPDGRALAVEGASGVVRLVRLPEPAVGDAATLTSRARALTSLGLSAAGDVRGLSASAWQAECGKAGAGGEDSGLPWHLRRGLDRVEVGQWAAALWHLDRRLREQSDDWLALTLRARALANLGRTDEAAADFDHSFEKGPAETVAAWHLLAAQNAPLDDPGKPIPGKPRRGPVAVWFLERLLAHDSRETVPLLMQRARTRERGGANRWERAAEDYDRAARLAPDDAALLLEVARAHADHNERDKAAEYFVKAADAALQGDDTAQEAARALTRLERWDEAAQCYLRAFDRAPDDPGVAAARATICLDLAHSQPVFERAVKLRPKEPQLWAGRARSHVQRGEWKEAAADFARSVELADLTERSYEHAACLLILGDEKGYRELVTHLVERGGETEDPFLAYTLARTCVLTPKSGIDPARSVAWAERAVAAEANGWYLHALGLALYRKGDYEGALARLTESEKTDWVPVLNRLALAMTHHRLGHADEARKYLAQATEFMDNRPATKPFTAAQLSTDVEEALLLRREADELILGKKP